MDCSLPGSSVHGILQARILEGVAVSFSRGFPQPGDQTCISCVSCIVGRFFPIEPLGKTLTTICIYFEWSLNWSDFACKQLCSRSFCRGSVSIYFSVFEEACLLPFFLKNIVTSEVGHCLCSPSLELSRFCHHDWRQEFHFLSECLKSFFFNVKVEYNQVVSCCFAFWTKISWHFNLGIPFFSISWKFSFLWICILFPLLWSLFRDTGRPFIGEFVFHIGEGDDTPVQHSCLENPRDGGAWWAAVHGVAESRTWLSDFTFTFHFQALEKEMATHSSVLAWRIPGTGEPGGLPSMGSHRVRHDWSDLAAVSHIC